MVEDTGQGINVETLARLFKPFSQDIPENSSVGQLRMDASAGLGLTISQKFVEAMGGCIRVSSQVNVGTKFSFEFEAEYVEQQPIAV